MPRGRLLKTKVREARELEKAKTIGHEKALLSMDKLKFNSNNIGLQLKKKLLELDFSTSSKIVATVGLMFVIKAGIDWTQIHLERFQRTGIYGFLPDLFADIVMGVEPDTDQDMNLTAEIAEWVASFGVAYLIVENFGEIVTAVGAGLSSIIGIAKTMLGSGLVPV